MGEVFKGVSCSGTGERGLPLPMDGGNWFLLVCNVITVPSLTGYSETDRCKIWNENCSNEVRAQTIMAASYHTHRPSLTGGPGLHSLVINCWIVHLFCLNQHCHNITAITIKIYHSVKRLQSFCFLSFSHPIIPSSRLAVIQSSCHRVISHLVSILRRTN